MVIALVALIVFGPERLPDISRKAGEMLAKAREMSRAFKDTVDAEYGDVTAPLKDLKDDYDAMVDDVKAVSSSLTGVSIEVPDVVLIDNSSAKDALAEPDGAATGDVPGDEGGEH